MTTPDEKIRRLNLNEYLLQQDLAKRTDFEIAINPIALAQAREAAQQIARMFELEDITTAQQQENDLLRKDNDAKQLALDSLSTSIVAKDELLLGNKKTIEDLTNELVVTRPASKKVNELQGRVNTLNGSVSTFQVSLVIVIALLLAAAGGDVVLWVLWQHALTIFH
jgi:hypothetical protein